ncbi:TetR/AcrR family transcriptional regulator [Azospirillum rugosum]|uniref:AcrR family transcriptional regulator n=2 Tax=Azospirillum rugosum TaxID=416170 RepID=A0ABS4SLA6_9PROT|nr:TetR/AcrR family transcriptional regulator [Azospirillum rugosum]MBP2293338.1 AcrR family transcriptional regulator [Azospirillum rugosum]
MTEDKPFGRDATTAALLDAADTLFGEKGPSAVTVREISARANVNHALLHRHFGTKEALLDAIIDKHMNASKAVIEEAAEPDLAIRNLLRYLVSQPAFTRTFAHLILDQRPLSDFVRKNGGTADLAALLHRTGIDEAETRAIAAVVISFSLGWTLFRDLARYAASCDDGTEQLDERAIAMLTDLLHRAMAGAKAG